MNLRNIANGLTQAINPNVEAKIYKSTGWTINPDRSRSPSYDPPVTAMVQVQEMSQKDLQHIDSLGLQGKFKTIYVNGEWYGLDRSEGQGGDIFEIDGKRWRVEYVPEGWGKLWTKVVVCLQLT